MRLVLALLPVLAVLAPSPSIAQGPPFDPKAPVANIPRAELDAITTRGRLLFEYDVAAWHGTDAVLALRPADGSIEGYLARAQDDGRWEVVFGRLTPDGSAFLVAYRAVQRDPGGSRFDGYVQTPVRADSGWYARAARALDVGRREFGRPSRPYNAMVVPADGGSEWYVYLVPAPTRAGVWPNGGDVRYRVSADGRTLLERRRLHNEILEFTNRPEAGKTLEAGVHTAVLDDRPEDTDVFHVLRREPRLPQYVVSDSHYFRIDVDGRITAWKHDLGRRRD